MERELQPDAIVPTSLLNLREGEGFTHAGRSYVVAIAREKHVELVAVDGPVALAIPRAAQLRQQYDAKGAEKRRVIRERRGRKLMED
jgi:hypothetical protein